MLWRMRLGGDRGKALIYVFSEGDSSFDEESVSAREQVAQVL